MAQFRKKPVVVEASRWFKNGDHPHDYADERPFMESGCFVTKPGEFFREKGREGGVVRYFRHPAVDGNTVCVHCGQSMHSHGWIDTLKGGHIVCPGDYVITGVKSERYPCKPDIFAATYEQV